MWPKIIASSLDAISGYQRFHRNALLLDSEGNLYFTMLLLPGGWGMENTGTSQWRAGERLTCMAVHEVDGSGRAEV